MWYGLKIPLNFSRASQNSRQRLNMRDRRIGKPLQRRNSFPARRSTLLLPRAWRVTILKQSKADHPLTSVFVYSDTYFVNVAFRTEWTDLGYVPNLHLLTLRYKSSSHCYSMFLRAAHQLFSRFSRPFFLKIRFKGKGYYLYKNKRNTIAPQFGYAHRLYVYSPANAVKFLTKTKLVLFGLSKKDVLGTGYSLKKTRPIKIFTGRGVRFARQVIYRKTGKVSSYR